MESAGCSGHVRRINHLSVTLYYQNHIIGCVFDNFLYEEISISSASSLYTFEILVL